jgi:branched-chain amino acid aminotransferase
VIETWKLPGNDHELNKNGLAIDLYEHAKKSCDLFSNLKSNNYLPYTMAALYARQKSLDDCLILNAQERICEATIANVFWIRDGLIFTPPLSEGCVAGVMRRHLLQVLPHNGYTVIEQRLTREEIKKADELFLTNAVSGMRWVDRFQDKEYTNTVIKSIFSILF